MGYDMTALDGEYFRLNIWGMGRYREAMWGYGMLHEHEQGPWPPDPEDIDWDEFYDNEDSYPEHRKVLDDYKSASGDGPGIAIHKFGSNDGWLVTPAEIKSALEAYEALGSPNPFADDPIEPHSEATLAMYRELRQEPPPPFDPADYWNQWIAYLRHSAKVGGFRVY